MFQSLTLYGGTSVQRQTASFVVLREEAIAAGYSIRPHCFEVVREEHLVMAALRQSIFIHIKKKMTNSIFLSYCKPKVAVLKYLNRILTGN